jgi:hypothetical protein
VAAAEAARRAAFQRLRPICAPLLQLRKQPAELRARLEALQEEVAGLDPSGLSGCWDYVTFPLLLAVDSIAASRRARQQGQQGQQQRGGAAGQEGAGEEELAVPAASTDRVAEAVLGGCRPGPRRL